MKTVFRHIAKDCMTVLYAFAAVGILAALALNISFLNPVAQIMKGFSMTDIYYNVQQEYSVPDTSRVITIVDMSDIRDRYRLAEVLEEIDSLKPKAVGVDIVFEGWNPDTLGDNKVIEVAGKVSNTVFSYRMFDYVNDTIGYSGETHSFFTDIVPVKQGFTNYERTLYGALKRVSHIKNICMGDERTSLVYEVSNLYSDGQLREMKSDKVNINFRPTHYRVVPADSLVYYADLIKDHIVLYGAMHELADMHYTPIGEIAGIELLAYSIQTILEQSEVRHPNLFVTAIISFIIVLLTFWWKTYYIDWAKRRKSEALQFFLTTTFVVGMMLFLWSALLMGIGFVLFSMTSISINFGWALAAIPFISGAREFFGLTIRNISGYHLF